VCVCAAVYVARTLLVVGSPQLVHAGLFFTLQPFLWSSDGLSCVCVCVCVCVRARACCVCAAVYVAKTLLVVELPQLVQARMLVA